MLSRYFRLGLFVLGTLVMFAVAVFWVGSKSYLFRSTYRLRAEFQNVSGLIEGAEVRVGGIHRGTVRRIELPQRSDGKVKVVMELDPDTRAVIRKDSLAAVHAEGMIGDKYMEISFGSPDAPAVGNDDTIRSVPPLEMADLVRKANGLLDSAGNAMGGLDAALTNLKSISSKIDRGAGTAGALVNDKSAYASIAAGADAFKDDMEALKHNFLLRGFFHKRGYQDETEITKDAIEQLPANTPVRRFSIDAEKMFDKPDTAKRKKPDPVKPAGQFLEHNNFGLAVIAVSSDMKGDSDRDRLLTQARAAVVRKYLAQNFKLDDRKIKTLGMGKSPDVSEGSRIDIVVYPPGQKAPPPAKSAK